MKYLLSFLALVMLAMATPSFADTAVLPYSRTDPVFQVKCPTEGCDALIDLEEYVTRVRRGYAS